MTVRLWIGRPGELMGLGSDGAPVMADENGVEPMTEIGGYITDFRIEPDWVTPPRLASGRDTWTFVPTTPVDFPSLAEARPWTDEEWAEAQDDDE